jgi:hypothetical protein
MECHILSNMNGYCFKFWTVTNNVTMTIHIKFLLCVSFFVTVTKYLRIHLKKEERFIFSWFQSTNIWLCCSWAVVMPNIMAWTIW